MARKSEDAPLTRSDDALVRRYENINIPEGRKGRDDQRKAWTR